MCGAKKESNSSVMKPLVRRSADAFLMCSPKEKKKSVSFATVQVRNYPIILGDNPSVTAGPPISIGWQFDAAVYYTVDEWEGERFTSRHAKSKLRVPESVRIEWLCNAGHTIPQIYDIIQHIQEQKYRRRLSLERSTLQDKADMVAESMRRKISRAVGNKGRSEHLKRWTLSPSGCLIPAA
mmetsp:Transcript_21964/g.53146  ORF Transcript_21964/g.53146 Transcript_21964/m.53146 type:complete len:181 (+) Transcript_21964:212-754(+)